jgi:cold shock CspA family protein
MSVFNSEDGIEEDVAVRVSAVRDGSSDWHYHEWPVGTVIYLGWDDGSDAPLFINKETGLDQYVHLSDVEPVE